MKGIVVQCATTDAVWVVVLELIPVLCVMDGLVELNCGLQWGSSVHCVRRRLEIVLDQLPTVKFHLNRGYSNIICG